ncbi:hypothetical protein AMATHDRAFT_66205 [Amanita thiersii Skay4041]|uniref:Uncharacterized protein n=1 Tax=Amanita thiersii Skay4041 TaxID=703135 RepID=A0A2A9NBV4_9AGAR|nr:hypothetical protein AMATHDRAFT_66205 [Amanita thiersii Skay4041]
MINDQSTVARSRSSSVSSVETITQGRSVPFLLRTVNVTRSTSRSENARRGTGEENVSRTFAWPKGDEKTGAGKNGESSGSRPRTSSRTLQRTKSYLDITSATLTRSVLANTEATSSSHPFPPNSSDVFINGSTGCEESDPFSNCKSKSATLESSLGSTGSSWLGLDVRVPSPTSEIENPEVYENESVSASLPDDFNESGYCLGLATTHHSFWASKSTFREVKTRKSIEYYSTFPIDIRLHSKSKITPHVTKLAIRCTEMAYVSPFRQTEPPRDSPLSKPPYFNSPPNAYQTRYRGSLITDNMPLNQISVAPVWKELFYTISEKDADGSDISVPVCERSLQVRVPVPYSVFKGKDTATFLVDVLAWINEDPLESGRTFTRQSTMLPGIFPPNGESPKLGFNETASDFSVIVTVSCLDARTMFSKNS